jgi:lactate dehydrogenase-like 2-hydroxyacid dehydrogenase
MKKPDILLVAGMADELADLLEPHFTVHRVAGTGEAVGLPVELRRQIRGLITAGGAGVTPELIEAYPALEIVSCYSVGYDGVDAKHAASKGIVITHTPDVLNDEVANTAIALLLATTRRVVAFDKYLRQGRWSREGPAPLTRGLAGKRVGIVGMGRIGMAIAEKLAAFKCDIVYHNRSRRPELDFPYYDDLDAMAADCDILIVMTPGGPATRNLINAGIMSALGPDGTLINVSRGSVVDEKELVSALQTGKLGAAGLDVFAHEPNVPAELVAMENVVLLPHVGSATEETRAAMRALSVDNLVSWYKTGSAVTPVPECAHLNENGKGRVGNS